MVDGVGFEPKNCLSLIGRLLIPLKLPVQHFLVENCGLEPHFSDCRSEVFPGKLIPHIISYNTKAPSPYRRGGFCIFYFIFSENTSPLSVCVYNRIGIYNDSGCNLSDKHFLFLPHNS
jgi:hypothetical protein